MTFLNTRAPAGHRICRHLRCKEMYYTSEVETEREQARITDPDEDDRLYWCTKTCRPLGPEGKEANLHDCDPERSCYEA